MSRFALALVPLLLVLAVEAVTIHRTVTVENPQGDKEGNG